MSSSISDRATMEATMQDIREIAKKIGFTEDDIDLYGKYKAKVDYNVLKKSYFGRLFISILQPWSSDK